MAGVIAGFPLTFGSISMRRGIQWGLGNTRKRNWTSRCTAWLDIAFPLFIKKWGRSTGVLPIALIIQVGGGNMSGGTPTLSLELLVLVRSSDLGWAIAAHSEQRRGRFNTMKWSGVNSPGSIFLRWGQLLTIVGCQFASNTGAVGLILCRRLVGGWRGVVTFPRRTLKRAGTARLIPSSTQCTLPSWPRSVFPTIDRLACTTKVTLVFLGPSNTGPVMTDRTPTSYRGRETKLRRALLSLHLSWADVLAGLMHWSWAVAAPRHHTAMVSTAGRSITIWSWLWRSLCIVPVGKSLAISTFD